MKAIAFLIIFHVIWTVSSMPLAKRMVDLTYVLDERANRFPIFRGFKIDNLYNGTFETIWLQAEEFSTTTHIGTHMDSPAHFVKGGMTIEDIPVTEFVAPAAVIDITAKAALDADAMATTEDLMQWESGTGQSLNDTIIMLRSGWGDKYYDKPAYYGSPEHNTENMHFPGISGETCQWLVDNRSIKGIGTDTISLDVGTSRTYPCHNIILGRGLFILENVAYLEKIPIYGAKLYVLPMKIGRASGAPTRIVATVPEVIYELPSNTNPAPISEAS